MQVSDNLFNPVDAYYTSIVKRINSLKKGKINKHSRGNDPVDYMLPIVADANRFGERIECMRQ